MIKLFGFYMLGLSAREKLAVLGLASLKNNREVAGIKRSRLQAEIDATHGHEKKWMRTADLALVALPARVSSARPRPKMKFKNAHETLKIMWADSRKWFIDGADYRYKASARITVDTAKKVIDMCAKAYGLDGEVITHNRRNRPKSYVLINVELFHAIKAKLADNKVMAEIDTSIDASSPATVSFSPVMPVPSPTALFSMSSTPPAGPGGSSAFVR